MNRVIIYGDIHGCFDEFKMLRDELLITPKDTEILVGDLFILPQLVKTTFYKI